MSRINLRAVRIRNFSNDIRSGIQAREMVCPVRIRNGTGFVWVKLTIFIQVKIDRPIWQCLFLSIPQAVLIIIVPFKAVDFTVRISRMNIYLPRIVIIQFIAFDNLVIIVAPNLDGVPTGVKYSKIGIQNIGILIHLQPV